MNKQIVFVDPSVQDYQSLIQDTDRAQIFILDDKVSGIEQITNALANQKDIEVLVADPTRYDEGSVHMTVGDHVLLLHIQDVVEKTDACARVRFTVVGIES